MKAPGYKLTNFRPQRFWEPDQRMIKFTTRILGEGEEVVRKPDALLDHNAERDHTVRQQSNDFYVVPLPRLCNYTPTTRAMFYSSRMQHAAWLSTDSREPFHRGAYLNPEHACEVLRWAEPEHLNQLLRMAVEAIQGTMHMRVAIGDRASPPRENLMSLTQSRLGSIRLNRAEGERLLMDLVEEFRKQSSCNPFEDGKVIFEAFGGYNSDASAMYDKLRPKTLASYYTSMRTLGFAALTRGTAGVRAQDYSLARIMRRAHLLLDFDEARQRTASLAIAHNYLQTSLAIPQGVIVLTLMGCIAHPHLHREIPAVAHLLSGSEGLGTALAHGYVVQPGEVVSVSELQLRRAIIDYLGQATGYLQSAAVDALSAAEFGYRAEHPDVQEALMNLTRSTARRQKNNPQP